MPNAYLSPVLRETFLDNNGSTLAGGLLWSYQAGSTTPAATYTDSTATTPNPNPIVLNSRGEAPSGIWIPPGQSFKFVLADSNNATIYTVDNVVSQSAQQTGSFTLTGVGFSNTVTFACKYTVYGNIATVAIPANSGTSNSNFFALSGVPAILQPPTFTQFPGLSFAVNNGAVINSGLSMMVGDLASTWQVFLNDSSGNWATTGLKGLAENQTFSYLLI